MNITTKFITSQYIKSTTVVNEFVNDMNIDSFIYGTQDTWIKPILGTTLYDNLVQEIVNNSGSTTGLTTNYQTLLDYVQPVTAYYLLYDALPYFSIKISSNGIIKRSGSNFEPIEVAELQFIRKDLLEKAKQKETLLREFLTDNKSIYYDNTIPDKNKRNVAGFYF